MPLSKRCIYLYVWFIICLHFCVIYCQNEENTPLVIKKCACQANEVQTIKGCQEHNSSMLIEIWDATASSTQVVNISSLSLTIQPLECPPSFAKDILREGSGAFITTEGTLIGHLFPETDLYCLENIRNEAEDMFQIIEMCTERLPIRLCCGINEYMDSSKRCTKIPIELMKKEIQNLFEKFNHTMSTPECKDGKLINVEFLSPHIPILEMKKVVMKYEERFNKSFCFGVYGDENEIYIGPTFCSTSVPNDMSDMNLPSIPYCCQMHYAYSQTNGTCVLHNEDFIFPQNIQWPANGAKQIPSIMNCTEVHTLELHDTESYSFMSDGSLVSNTSHKFLLENYCLGAIIMNNSTNHSGFTCVIDEPITPCLWRWEIYRACMGISSFFLVATLVVYIGVAELRRKIGGICLISELWALLISQITLIVIQTYQASFSVSGCLTAGVIVIIFVLASFFWLTIMCYDVWSTFRVLRAYSEKLLNPKVFLKYSLFGWAIPVVVGVMAAIAQKLDLPFNPNFTPQSGCFFTDQDLSLPWLYMYGIILVLLVANCAFFTHLSKTLFMNQHKKMKDFNRSGVSSTQQSNTDIENMKVNLKLFVIMGVPWLIEVFTTFAGSGTVCYIWILDLFNMLRGVFIFVIFVCKKSTRDLVLASWFPSYQPQAKNDSRSRKASTISMTMTSWLPSMRSRKVSKISMSSLGAVNPLETVKEDGFEEEEEESHHSRII